VKDKALCCAGISILSVLIGFFNVAQDDDEKCRDDVENYRSTEETT
jgi:hypothetical protein